MTGNNVHALFDKLLLKPDLPLNGHQPINHPRSSEFTDEALALRFTERHKDDLRFIDTWSHWMRWDGQRWRQDTTQEVVSLSRDLVRDTSTDILDRRGSEKLASHVASAKVISALERLARADRRHASRPDEWDQDLWLLNTPDGTVDLRTGKLRPHERRDLITKITTVGPGGDCPLWRRFLGESFAGDKELIAFLQRVMGYSLTGATNEHALFFCYGTGANGKGVCLNTFSGILGDYSRIAPMETFTSSGHERSYRRILVMDGVRRRRFERAI
jgi:putative DNA primase/helicase